MQRRNFIKYGLLSLTAVVAEAKGIGLSTSGAKWVRFYSNGCMAAYRDSLYAFIDIDVKKREMRITGRVSTYKNPAPKLDDFSAEYREKHNYATDWTYIYPVISDRLIKW